MTDITMDRFGDFFRELHGREPYSWQSRLADRAVKGDWPGAIDLPTGSGKTACIDITVFALACLASRPVQQRTTPRRIFFCVNRRVIVDEAHQRAQRIAKGIWQAERNGAEDKPVLRDVAAALRSVAGTSADHDTPPLDVLELRGGIYRDNRWSRSVTQPTIVCTTIDQLGSRLLFRGYGVSSNAAPIQAALIAYDSLILLDEAHISEPFRQTLDYVQRYVDPQKWAEQPIGVRPMCVVPMTATPTEKMIKRGVIRLVEHDRQNESLNRRLTASKPTELREDRDVITAAVKAAMELAKEKLTATGVIVNRVATARAVYQELIKKTAEATVELVIGSMRPMDRDDQAKRLRGLIGPDRPSVSEKTSFIVATQCIEVGADYDFDALVTECASLDALRQRFGRLNRGGREIDAKAVIIVNTKDIEPDNKLDDNKPLDPIYGNALARTWNWLTAHATEDSIDFGIDAFNKMLEEGSDDSRIPTNLLAPSASVNAPVMLPAYVDFWCQTAPRPVPDPDVALFLHGPHRGEPDVQVCWRADLADDQYMNPDQWCDVVALLPPTSAECMSVPMSRVKRWLADKPDEAANSGDLLGVAAEQNDENHRGRERPALSHRGVLWRSASESRLINSPGDLLPGDTIVLPVSEGGWNQLGHLPHDALGVEQIPDDRRIDVAEAAFRTARDRIALRIHPALRSLWPPGAAVDALFLRLADDDDQPTFAELRQLLGNVSDAPAADEQDDQKRTDLLRRLAKPSNLVRENYPDGRGAVLISRQRLGYAVIESPPALDDGDDEPSRTRREQPVPLIDHTGHVVDALLSTIAGVPTTDFADALRLAAELHDLGKADERFQAMLTSESRTDAWLHRERVLLLAKFGGKPLTFAQYKLACDRAGLPRGFRHEMLSVQLAERYDKLAADSADRDLILHLIAAHHGFARPFAPVVIDDDPPDVEISSVQLSGTDRLARPPHRLDSGVTERFWSLTRRFGWWGLAYLEALLRLADQQASAAEDAGLYDDAETKEPAKASA